MLAVHAAGDRPLPDRQARDGAGIVPVSTIVQKASPASKKLKTGAKRPQKNALGSPDDSQVVPIAEPRLVGYARVSTDPKA